MTFVIWLAVLAAIFTALWLLAPKGWMTKLWGVVWVLVEGSGEILQFLAQADWGTVLSDPQAFSVTLVCGVGVIIARMRGEIQART